MGTFTTGLKSLDEVLKGILPGDNVVWEVDDIETYRAFVNPLIEATLQSGRPIKYFRFASHPPLIPEQSEIGVHHFDPDDGFETFTDSIHQVIRDTGRGAVYIFDCLSELASAWLSDQMLGNFFRLTCPYLFDLETLAYFSIFRNQHSSEAIVPIQKTTQLFLDVYEHDGLIYLRPLKVQHRYSSSMNMFHVWKEDQFKTVTDSIIVAQILTSTKWSGLQRDALPGFWEREFLRAQEAVSRESNEEEKKKCFDRLLPMIFSRDRHIQDMARQYLTLSNLIEIRRRMIGTGLIGGKAVGMLLAQAILGKNDHWKSRLETHDSFFLGSDVFYTYLIKSKSWWIRWKQKNSKDLFDGVEEARRKLLSGTFPEDIQEQFREILDYFGQSPIVVRSSSLLEDAYGNSFSGKYESVFCVNQGTPERRLKDFMNAVKTVYASTMNSDALLYRYERGLLGSDEQMALLVQRVSGAMHGKYFFPQIAGVGFSYNLYVWDKSIDPTAGVLRLVFGLGTRAVNRSDDDYTRIVAVNEPGKRPEAGFSELRKYAQRKVDLLNLQSNTLNSEYFPDIIPEISGIPLELFASKDLEVERIGRERNLENWNAFILTFDGLFSDTEVMVDMRKILKTLEEAYNYPVDIEFTVNFTEDKKYTINLLQCRPFLMKRAVGIVQEPEKIVEENLIIKSRGPIMGASIHTPVDTLIYVVPSVYGKLSEKDMYAVADLVTRLANMDSGKSKTIMLLGPGRWGTTIPSLGVPIGFAGIRNVSVLCEIAEMHEGLVPDVSLGTHFFNDLVELDILYMAIYPEKSENVINREFLNNAENRLKDFYPEALKWSDAVRVIDFSDPGYEEQLYLNANSIEQRGLFYLDKKKKK